MPWYAGATPRCLWLTECFFGPDIFFVCFICVCGSSVLSAKNNTAHSKAILATWRWRHDSSVGHDVQASEDTQRAATGLGALGTRSQAWHGSHWGSLSRANQPLGHALLFPWRENLSISKMEPENKLV